MSKLYEALAEAFVAEGVNTQFVLMGDGNMHWSTAFARLPGVQTVHVRHEHCAVAAATAYNIATGKIAAASVTCGPGLTQLMTALPAERCAPACQWWYLPERRRSMPSSTTNTSTKRRW